MLRLSALFPIHSTNRGISGVFFSVCKEWQGPELKARMVVPSCDRECRAPNVVEAIPSFLKKLYYLSPSVPKIKTEKRFLKDIKDFDVAYLWPGLSVDIVKNVHKHSKPIFIERVNSYQSESKRILDDACSRLGLEPQHTITPKSIQDEKEKLKVVDFLFCPSPIVAKSFQEAGVPEEKLLLTTEGWSPHNFPNYQSHKPPQDEVNVLFLGFACVRKGVHLLLRAWELAGIKGTLTIFGSMEPAIAETCGDLLKRSDVVHFDYAVDYSSAYRQADFFAFPSLEEGSPLVIYEAMGHGLPILASPMGGGGIVRDGIDGIVLSPYDTDAWVEGLRKLSSSPDLRAKMGAAARDRALEFTWPKVAARRQEQILQKIQRN
ncbi:glycosyltransferase family 4 protein [Microcoleus sp. LEGE 07076]|uniref:glycosyltransferase family 4 protein n=1 Tax=Microcoleus sp. LEGE 07076 TaxID=915322 RepID=UPI001882AC98|nr:glycosyltransferase family 4 protein [Microcoleus sp. LEGE 07076]MBE9185683.1 glycosyltransferase family 4 protein [Microcoleus sp. LEGE 07076]